jgi:hypothetical protein
MMKKLFASIFLIVLCFGAIGQSTTPRFGTAANQDNTGRMLTWGYKSKAYQAVDTIKSRVYDYTYKVGTLTGALTLKAVVTGNYLGDRLNILFTDDGSGRVITFSTGFSSGGTLTMQASSKATVYFVFNGVGWYQLSGQNLVTGLVGAGSAAVPTLSFTGQTDQGFYNVSATELGMTVGGVKAAGLTTTGLNVVNVVGSGNGTVSLPAYTFISDPDCGIYRIGANHDGFAVNGAKVLDVATTGLSVTGNLTASAPLIRQHTLTEPFDSTGTIAAAKLAVGYITTTSGAAVTMTLPTATAMANQLGAVQGTIWEFWVDNTAGSNTITVAVGSGITASDFPGTNTLSRTASASLGVAGFRLTFFSATGATLTRIN